MRIMESVAKNFAVHIKQKLNCRLPQKESSPTTTTTKPRSVRFVHISIFNVFYMWSIWLVNPRTDSAVYLCVRHQSIHLFDILNCVGWVVGIIMLIQHTKMMVSRRFLA